MKPVCIAALYRFVALPEYASLRLPLLQRLQQSGIKGTLLLAPEGINGTVAGEGGAVDDLLHWLGDIPELEGRLANIQPHRSWHSTVPFARTKVKLKREIVSFGVGGIDPAGYAGTYVNPEDWNELISAGDVLTIDTRNDYEVDAGRFVNAINPGTRNFREFPAFVQQHLDTDRHSRVAMYCTGGIRCEKSTAYLKSLGFKNVFHLRGGILNYLDTVRPADSLWQGSCFVFDERETVAHPESDRPTESRAARESTAPSPLK